VAMVWFAGLIGLASAALARLRRPAVAVWSQRLAGASLVGVGLTAALTG
jgi:threonine/homoserine/homoserine lactone efflux protein